MGDIEWVWGGGEGGGLRTTVRDLVVVSALMAFNNRPKCCGRGSEVGPMSSLSPCCVRSCARFRALLSRSSTSSVRCLLMPFPFYTMEARASSPALAI